MHIFSKVITCALTTQEVYLRSGTQTYLTKFLRKHLKVRYRMI